VSSKESSKPTQRATLLRRRSTKRDLLFSRAVEGRMQKKPFAGS